MSLTPKQIADARALLKQTADTGFRPEGWGDALYVLLAATEPVEPPGADSSTRYMVLRKRADAPWEVYPPDNEEHARAAYDHLGTQWTATFLVRIVAGPREEVDAERPNMPRVFEELVAHRNALLARVEELEARADPCTCPFDPPCPQHGAIGTQSAPASTGGE